MLLVHRRWGNLFSVGQSGTLVCSQVLLLPFGIPLLLALACLIRRPPVKCGGCSPPVCVRHSYSVRLELGGRINEEAPRAFAPPRVYSSFTLPTMRALLVPICRCYYIGT